MNWVVFLKRHAWLCAVEDYAVEVVPHCEASVSGDVVYIHAGVESIGVSDGVSSDNLPLASTVVGMYKANGIPLMRIYTPD
jgi:hypothetical protein